MLLSFVQAKEDLEKAAEGEGETSKDAADMQQGDIVSVPCYYSRTRVGLLPVNLNIDTFDSCSFLSKTFTQCQDSCKGVCSAYLQQEAHLISHLCGICKELKEGNQVSL